jgi:hypothetical protein
MVGSLPRVYCEQSKEVLSGNRTAHPAVNLSGTFQGNSLRRRRFPAATSQRRYFAADIAKAGNR